MMASDYSSDGSGGDGGCEAFSLLPPVPWQEFGESGLRHVGDACEDVGKPGLRVDIVELGGIDQGGHGGRPLGSALRSGEQPRLSAQCKTAQGPLGGVVRQADPAILEEPGKA